jgi:large subunit ribosomal protein L25
MSEFTIHAEARDDLGKGASRRLRRLTGKVPAIVFGGKQKNPQALSVPHKDLLKHLESEAFFSSILTLNVDGKEERVILKDLQRHPSKPVVLHADFQRVIKSSPIKITVPLHFTNEGKSEAIRLGGKASHILNQVEIKCLPDNLPEYIEVNMQNIQQDQMLHLSDLVCPEGVTIPALALGADHDQPVATVIRKRK